MRIFYFGLGNTRPTARLERDFYAHIHSLDDEQGHPSECLWYPESLNSAIFATEDTVNLTATQRRQLHAALLGAFPTRDSLRLMVIFGLEERFEAIVGESNLRNAALDLILWAEARDKIAALIEAALTENPTNENLIRFALTMGLALPRPASLVPQEPPVLSALEQVRHYRELKAAEKRGDWERVSEIAATLDGYRDVPDVLDRLDQVTEEIIEAYAGGDFLHAIHLADRLGVVLPTPLSDLISDAWRFIPIQWDCFGIGPTFALMPDQQQAIISSIGDNGKRTLALLHLVAGETRSEYEISDGQRRKNVDLALGDLVRPFDGDPGEVTVVTITPDNRLAISGSIDGTIHIWDLVLCRQLRAFPEHAARVTAIVTTMDGSQILSGDETGIIRLWDSRTGRLLKSLVGHTGRIEALVISDDGRQAVSASFGSIRLWDLTAGALLHRFDGPLRETSVGDMGSTKVLVLPHQTRGVEARALAMRRDASQLLSGHCLGFLTLWMVASGKAMRGVSSHGSSVSAVAWAPNERYALSLDQSGGLHVCDIGNSLIRRRFYLGRSSSPGLPLLGSTSDGSRIVFAYSGYVSILNLPGGLLGS